MRRIWPVLIGLSLLFFYGNLCAKAELDSEEEAITVEDEIVVTATRIPVLVSEAPGSVQVITREEIDQSVAQDMAELLALYLGVQLNTTGMPGGVSSVNLRGAYSEQVLIMINGIPMGNPQNGSSPLSFITLDMVERVEIAHGPLSSLYGESALGGVVNIITGGKPGTRFGVGVGSWDAFNGHFSYAKEQYGFGVGGLKTDGHRENSNYKGDWQYGFYRPEWSDWKLDIGFYRYQDKKGLPGTTVYPSFTDEGEDGQIMVYLTANRSHGHGDLTIRLYNVDVISEYRGDWSNAEHKAYRQGVELQNTWEFNPALSLVTVGKWEETGVDSSSIGDKSATTKSLAAQLCWSPMDNLQIYAGDLVNDSSLFETGHSPRVSMVYQVKPGFVLKAMGGKAFRAPTFNELYWPSDPYSHGNPDLRPETGQTWEIGAEYQWLDRWIGKLSLYDSRIDNLIEWRPVHGDPWNDPWTPTNYGRVRLQGIDASMAWKITSRWKLATHINLLDAKELNETTGSYDLKLDSKTPVYATLMLTYQYEKIRWNWSTRYFQEYGNVPTAVVSDMSIAYRLTPQSMIRLGIQNIFDRDYLVVAGYPMPDFNLRLGMEITF